MTPLHFTEDIISHTTQTVILAPGLLSLSIASTEFAYLRALLSAPGHSATVYYLAQPDTDFRPASVRALAEMGVTVSILPCDGSFRGAPSAHGQLAEAPAQILAWARQAKPRHIHFLGSSHSAYYLLQARKTGLLDFGMSVLLHVVTTYGYRMAVGRETIKEPADLAKLQIEIAALAMADGIVAQSKTIADWVIDHQYVSKKNVRIAPPFYIEAPTRNAAPAKRKEKCVLFSGTLTETKGVATAVYTLRYLRKVHGASVHPVFSGRIEADFPAAEFLAAELGQDGLDFELLEPIEHQAFLKRLCEADLVVVPSRIDENPAIVQECVALGIPVITTATGDFSSSERTTPNGITVRPHDYIALGDAIAAMLQESRPATIHHPPPDCSAAKQKDWNQFIANLFEPERSERSDGCSTTPQYTNPLVSICVAHHNRPELLELAVESIVNQSYKNIEIIVVDDGSSPANAHTAERMIAGIENATLIRKQNRYLGAARNTAGKNARGAFLLFKDDDNYAKPHEVETLVGCALETNADILTCFSDNFVGDGRPSSDTLTGVRRMPFGPALGFNLFRNGFGDSNCLVKRPVWQDLGGFTEHYRIGLDDHEFFLRALLKGYDLELVPEALYYYRLGGEKMKRFHLSKRANEQRIMATLTNHSNYSLLDVATLYLARNLVDRDCD